jgi:integrase
VAEGAASDLPDLTRSFERHLRLKNLAPRTIVSYLQAARLMTEWLLARYGPVDGGDLTAEHLGEYFRHLQEGPKLLLRTTRAGATMVPSGDAKRSAATVAGHYRTLQQFFKYLVDEGDIAASPLAALPRPKVPEKPVPVVKDHELEALFKTLGGKDFDSRRDNAVFRLFLDCGVRLDELGRLAVESLDFTIDEIVVWGKGRRPRIVPFSEKTGVVLERYLRERLRHPAADRRFASDDPDDPRNGNRPLWLGAQGWLTGSGVYQIIRKRSRAAPGEHVHPHQLRHTAAHQHAAAGMSETDMMRVFGWRSSEMPKRYGSSAADERAREAKRRLGLGNRF